jgi:hypothetical protein
MNRTHTLIIIFIAAVLATLVPVQSKLYSMTYNHVTIINPENLNVISNYTYWKNPPQCDSGRTFDSFAVDKKNGIAFTTTECMTGDSKYIQSVTTLDLRSQTLKKFSQISNGIGYIYFDETSGNIVVEYNRQLLYSFNPDTFEPIKLIANLSAIGNPYYSLPSDLKDSKFALFGVTKLNVLDIRTGTTVSSSSVSFVFDCFKLQFRGDDEIIVSLQKSEQNMLYIGAARFKIYKDHIELVDSKYTSGISTQKKYSPSVVDSILIEDGQQLLITWTDAYFENIGKVVYQIDKNTFYNTEGPWKGRHDQVSHLFEYN